MHVRDMSPAQVCFSKFKEFLVHLRQSMMADANTNFECQVQFPELRAMRTQQSNLLSKSLEMRGLLDALCKVLIDAGVVSGQRLLAEAHRQSFAAVRRSHPCGWGMSFVAHIPEQRGCIQRCLLFRKQEGLWACAQRPKPSPLAWQRCPQRGPGPRFSFGEVMDLPKIPSRFSTRSRTRGRLPHRLRNSVRGQHQR